MFAYPLTDPCQFDILPFALAGGKSNAIETARVHHAVRRRSDCVAARGAGAAGRARATSWRAVELCRKRFGSAVDGGGASSNAAGIGMGGGPQHPDRHSLADTR